MATSQGSPISVTSSHSQLGGRCEEYGGLFVDIIIMIPVRNVIHPFNGIVGVSYPVYCHNYRRLAGI